MSWKGRSPIQDPNEYLTKEEFKAIYNNVIGTRDKALVFLLYRSGRRPSEILGDRNTNSEGIKVRDIDFKSNTINFIILKKNPIRNRPELSRKEREALRKRRKVRREILPVNPSAMDMLKTLCIGRNPEEPVFRNRSGRSLTRSYLDHVLADAGKKAGITRRIHAKMLRHSFGIDTSAKCKNPTELLQLSELMSHGDINITTGYLRFAPKSPLRRLVANGDEE